MHAGNQNKTRMSETGFNLLVKAADIRTSLFVLAKTVPVLKAQFFPVIY